MPENPYDKAARFAAKLDPEGFLAWVLGLPLDRLGFAGWIDTRGIPFPGEQDRTGDTVARLDVPGGTEPPWAVAVEFQAEPDPLMFGRLLGYLSQIWMQLKPDPERGSRFQVGAAVLNLTGTGQASREMRLPGGPLVTHLGVAERNLARESADDTLRRVEAGELTRGVLPWVPLMTGAEGGMITDRWKRLAEAEPVSRRRAELAGLALVFATAAKRRPEWELALEGWNMIECSIMDDWIAKGREMGIAQGKVEGRTEGEAMGLAESLTTILTQKFSAIPADLADVIRAATDLAKLRQWVGFAVKADTIEALRAAAGV